jgi:hypothetical protein
MQLPPQRLARPVLRHTPLMRPRTVAPLRPWRPLRLRAISMDDATDLIDFHMYAIENRLDAIAGVLEFGVQFVFAYAVLGLLISALDDRR